MGVVIRILKQEVFFVFLEGSGGGRGRLGEG